MNFWPNRNKDPWLTCKPSGRCLCPQAVDSGKCWGLNSAAGYMGRCTCQAKKRDRELERQAGKLRRNREGASRDRPAGLIQWPAQAFLLLSITWNQTPLVLQDRVTEASGLSRAGPEARPARLQTAAELSGKQWQKQR